MFNSLLPRLLFFTCVPAAVIGLAQSGAPGPKIYLVGGDVSTPRLLSADVQSTAPDTCANKRSGKIELSFVIDCAGVPRNIGYRASEVAAPPDIPKFYALAAKIIASARFAPALRDGEPVPVSYEGILKLPVCNLKGSMSADGDSADRLRTYGKPELSLGTVPIADEDAQWALAFSDPKEPIDGGKELDRAGGSKHNTNKDSDPAGSKVLAPRPLNSVEANFSLAARRNGISGIVLISGVVGVEGKLHDLRVVRPLGFGLDEQAKDAAAKYRFAPATKDGVPFPVIITIEVNFRFT